MRYIVRPEKKGIWLCYCSDCNKCNDCNNCSSYYPCNACTSQCGAVIV